AYSILKTGRDEWGQFLPLHFKSYGEYKLPAQIYASIPAIAVFGLNELGVRTTPVIYGTLTVLFLYFLAKKMFDNLSAQAGEWIGLISAFFLAISPWHIQLTRASFESSFAVMWIVIGIWWLVKGFEKPKWLIASVIPFAISVYTYNSARVFTPLFLASILLIFRKKFLAVKKETIISGILFFVSLLPLVPFILSGEASARYKLVSITDDAGLIPRIEERRNLSKLPPLLTKLIHNRITYNSFYFAKNYLAHFSPNFLFINGAGHKQHHVQGVGELYAIQAPFWLAGWYFLFKKKHSYRGLILAWVLITFIPVSMTNDSIPNALRTLIAAPVYQIITALGIYNVWLLLKSKKIINISVWFISGLVLIFSFAGYLKNYYQKYPVLYSRDWQYGYKQAAGYIKDRYNDYDLIVFSRTYGEPHMFTLFFLNWAPAKFQNDTNLDRFEAYQWVWVLKFDKFYFPDLGDTGTRYQDIVNANPEKKILFVGKPGDFPENTQKLFKVNFLNGNEAFEIVESK
ncbi:MAG: glycosyltransferase family 39 protein, partial [Candidatus Woesebacteria bacterium]|nr:glycosyltransferase family 39 protein [Candidatus Woesebacteria bacterium]